MKGRRDRRRNPNKIMLEEQAGVQVDTSGGKAEIIYILERQATRGGGLSPCQQRQAGVEDGVTVLAGWRSWRYRLCRRSNP